MIVIIYDVLKYKGCSKTTAKLRRSVWLNICRSGALSSTIESTITNHETRSALWKHVMPLTTKIATHQEMVFEHSTQLNNLLIMICYGVALARVDICPAMCDTGVRGKDPPLMNPTFRIVFGFDLD